MSRPKESVLWSISVVLLILLAIPDLIEGQWGAALVRTIGLLALGYAIYRYANWENR